MSYPKNPTTPPSTDGWSMFSGVDDGAWGR